MFTILIRYGRCSFKRACIDNLSLTRFATAERTFKIKEWAGWARSLGKVDCFLLCWQYGFRYVATESNIAVHSNYSVSIPFIYCTDVNHAWKCPPGLSSGCGLLSGRASTAELCALRASSFCSDSIFFFSYHIFPSFIDPLLVCNCVRILQNCRGLCASASSAFFIQETCKTMQGR
jgi:hypothetical protein